MNTHVIDGMTYVEVDRNAEVGDKVLIVNAFSTKDNYVNGTVFEVNDLMPGGIASDSAKTDAEGFNPDGYITRREYRVLEPQKPTLSELLAKCTPENRHAAIEFDKPQVIDMLANLARRVTQLEQQLAATQRNLETFAGQTEDNSEDIRELDGRTQVLGAINKYYAEGSR
jgi:hypothetical protein